MSASRVWPRRDLFRTAAASLAATFGAGALASASQNPEPPAVPPAKPEDVASIDAILAAIYDVISGAKGEERDWDRFRSLFAADARLIPCITPAEGGAALRMFTPDEFARRAAEATKQGAFFEREIGRKIDRFGHIAHVFSAYESTREENGEPFDRGINSFQLFWNGERWSVVTIFWDHETPEQPIPPEYIQAEQAAPSP